MRQDYVETFENGAGGWLDCFGNGDSGVRPHERDADGALVSRGPWWVDYNHAPPGGGYLHLLFCLHTKQSSFTTPAVEQAGGRNRFIENGFPTDFTNARFSVRLRGEVELKGAQCLLLIQASVPEVGSGEMKIAPFVLTGQPFEITREYSDQTVMLSPDPSQWKALGSRHDCTETYGVGRIEDVLRDLNCDLMLVFHPLDVSPAQERSDNFHLLKAGEDFELDRARLPSGFVALREVRIEFAAV